MNLPMTIKRFSEATGYSEQAVRDKIYKCEWLEGVHYTKAPDSRVLILPEGFLKWAMKENSAASVRRRPRQS